MQTAQRVAVNTGFLYARMAITVFISLYSTRLVLAALGVNDFGIFNVVGGAISMLTFLNAAMTVTSQRFLSYYHGNSNLKKLRGIFNSSIILHFFIGIIILLILEGAGYFFFNGILTLPPERTEAAKLVYHFMIASTFFTIISVPFDAVINAHENMLFVAVVGIIEAFFKLGAAIFITFSTTDDLVSYGFIMALISFLLMIVRFYYSKMKYEEVKINISLYFDKRMMREMTSFASWSFLTSSSGIISQYGMGVVLNHFWGTVLNAAHGIAGQLNGQLMAFSTTMLKALNPVIDKSEGSGNRQLMLNASLSGSKLSFLLLSFFAIPFLIETPYILDIWLGDTPEWSILFCRLLLVRSLTEQLTISLSSSVYAQGNIADFSKVRSILNIAPIILTIILFIYGFPPYYLYISWIFCWSILGGITVLYYAHKNCGLEYSTYLNKVLYPCLLLLSIVTLSGLLPHKFFNEGSIRLAFVLISTSISFAISLWKISLNKKEKELIEHLSSKVCVLFKNKIGK